MKYEIKKLKELSGVLLEATDWDSSYIVCLDQAIRCLEQRDEVIEKIEKARDKHYAIAKSEKKKRKNFSEYIYEKEVSRGLGLNEALGIIMGVFEDAND